MSNVNAISTAITNVEATTNNKARELMEVEERIKDLTSLLIHINNNAKEGDYKINENPEGIALVEKIKGHSPEIFQEMQEGNYEWIGDDLDDLKENIRNLQKNYDIDVSSMQKQVQHMYDLYKQILDMARKIHEADKKQKDEMLRVGKG